MTKRPDPPSTLARRGATLWRRTLAEAEFSASELSLVEALCAAFDTWSDAQKIVKADGIIVVDRYGGKKPHPAVAIARDASTTMGRLAKQLDLELADDVGPSVRSPYRAKPGPRR